MLFIDSLSPDKPFWSFCTDSFEITYGSPIKNVLMFVSFHIDETIQT